MSKTKFEILMSVEVADVNEVPISKESICDGLYKLLKEGKALDIKCISVERTGRVVESGVVKEVCDECDKPSDKFVQCDDAKCCPSCATEWEKAEQIRQSS